MQPQSKTPLLAAGFQTCSTPRGRICPFQIAFGEGLILSWSNLHVRKLNCHADFPIGRLCHFYMRSLFFLRKICLYSIKAAAVPI